MSFNVTNNSSVQDYCIQKTTDKSYTLINVKWEWDVGGKVQGIWPILPSLQNIGMELFCSGMRFMQFDFFSLKEFMASLI